MLLLGMSLTALLLCVASTPSHGCGIDWTVPTNHFEGVNEQGYVSYWEKVGEVDLGARNGGELKLPLIISFRSDREKNSPYLGHGWMLALLESHIFQVEENRFMLVQPDGLQRWFWREKPGDTVLKGQGNWMAEIRGNTVSAWADCGWRLDYVKGKITGLTTPKNRKLEFVYNGSAVVAVRENGVTRLSVETDAAGSPSALVFNGRRLEIAQGEKPRVQVIAGQNVIGGMDRSLKKLTGSRGPSDHFEFAVNSKLQPTLKITSKNGIERLIAWDPARRRVAADGTWTYDIKPGEGAFNYAAIGRVNVQKQREFWHLDAAGGRETVQGIDGVRRVKTWFTSGKLAGKLRKVEEIKGNEARVVRQLTYGEDARLLREMGPDGILKTYTYDEQRARILSKNPPPTPEELNRIEMGLAAIIGSSDAEVSAKQNALYELALFYIGRRHDSSKARQLARLILSPQRQFNVILQSFDHDPTLTAEQKVMHYKELISEFPHARGRIDRLIEIRSNDS